LDPATIQRFSSVGITAGASTPHWVFREVVGTADRILQDRSALARWPRALLIFGVHTYLFIGAGSAAMTYAALRLLQIEPRFNYLFLSFMYVVSMHLFNRYTDRAAARLNDPHRMALLEKYQALFITVVVLFAGASLFLSYGFGVVPFGLMLLSLAAGIGYNMKIIPAWSPGRFRWKKVKEIPGSKDLFVASAWALVTVLIPFLAVPSVPFTPALCVFFFMFIMVFIRSLVFDMKDLEGDRIVGKETFPLIMGPRSTNRLVALCTFALAMIAALDAVFSWSGLGGLLLLPVVAYVGLYQYLYYRRILCQGVAFELAVDAQFILMGLLAYVIPR
jgi:4-hydroxy-3-methylbut-2-enyl diphosphate reductase